VTINVTNSQPTVQPDTYSILHDKVLFSPQSVLSNDTDGDGDMLRATVFKGPTQGKLTFDSLGNFSYIPNPGFVGTDTFTYNASDGAETVPETVTINVTNSQPTAQPDTYSILHDKVLFSAQSVLSNDSDGDGDMLRATVATGPTQGKLVFDSFGNFNYTPNPGFVGTDTFTYSVSDGAETVPATVTINVTNSQPTVQPDTYSIQHDKVLLSVPSVLSNDSDGDGDTLSAALFTGPTNGTIIFNPDGTFNYTPNPGFAGTDTFTYSASDGAQAVPATVKINVTNSLPTANPDTYSLSAGKVLSVKVPGVLANDSDSDLDTLTAAVAANPTKGSIALNKDGSFTYTPNAGFFGTDTFTYTVSDGIVNSAPLP
jgi:hypothetical protein